MDERDARDADPTEPVDLPAGSGERVEPDATTLPLPIVAAPTAAVPPLTQPVFPPAAGPGQPVAAPVAPAPRRKRHRGRRVTLGIGIPVIVLVVLGAVGWFGGNEWAKGAVISRVAQDTRSALGMSPGDAVSVEVTDPILPQLAAGRLDEMTITVPKAPLGKTTGDVTVHATGVPTRGDGPASSAQAEITMSPKALKTLAGDIGDTVPGSMHLSGGDIAVSLDPSQFLSGVSFELTLKPSVDDGELVLTPKTFTVAGGEISADTVRARFGTLAEGILAPRHVCVASAFPAGMTLKELTVASDALTTRFAVDPDIIHDPALQKPGSCS